MNQRGAWWFIPVIVVVLAFGAYKVGGFGAAGEYEQCDMLNPLGRSCQTGLECKDIGLLNSICVPKAGIGGVLERFLYSLSLDNLVCGEAGLVSPVCRIAVPLIALIIGAGVLALIGLLVAGYVGVPLNVGAIVGAVVGGIIGLGVSSFISFYWWVLLIIALALAVLYFGLKGGN